MAIPNNYNFSMKDVVDELSGSSYANVGLDFLLSFASNDKFDPAYEGSKNSLRNFRNYDYLEPYGTKRQTVGYGSSSTSACNSTQFVFFIEYGKSWASTTKIWSNFEGTINAPSRWYSDGSRARYWNGSSFTSLSFC